MAGPDGRAPTSVDPHDPPSTLAIFFFQNMFNDFVWPLVTLSPQFVSYLLVDSSQIAFIMVT